MSAVDIAVRTLAVLGLPSVTGWFLYDRRRLKNDNTEDEATLPDRVRTSSVVSLEAEIAALRSSFDTDRRIKDETIVWLRRELDQSRVDISSRDALIDGLQSQITGLQMKLAQVTHDLEGLQHELTTLRGHSG